MARFQERFVDNKGFFYPGETMIGHIEISLPEQIQFHQLTVKFKGKANCHWTEGSGDDFKLYYNNEVYFNEKIVLLASPMPSEKIPLGPGEYTYPFCFTLPKNLPPSFQNHPDESCIQYYMKVAFDAENYRVKSDIEEKLLPPFKVRAAPADLSKMPQLLEPLDSSKAKTLCCLCCKSGPIRLSCQIDKQVFQPGEDIVFNVQLDNTATDQELREVKARLVKAVVLFNNNTSEQNSHENDVCKVVITEGIKPRGEENWQSIQLTIPKDTVPTFDNCACVHVSYKFLVEVDIPNAFDVNIEFPVLIANHIQVNQPQSAGLQPAWAPPVTIQPGGIELLPSQPPPPYQT